MSLKDNFNQAVREIKDGLVGKRLSEESKKSSSLDGFLGQQESVQPSQAASTAPEAPVRPVSAASSESSYSSSASASPSYAEAAAAQNIREYTQAGAAAAAEAFTAASAASSGTSGYGSDPLGAAGSYTPPRAQTPKVTPPPIQPKGNEPRSTPYYENEETTVISKNIVVNGGTITGFANVHIDGGVKCDVRITKDVSVTGKVVGDIECNNAVMAGSSVQGNVASKGQLRMDRDSVLLGDIASQYLDMNGRIKGNIDVSGKAEFKTDAVIVGDISASTITVLDGAVIKGFVNTTFLQESQANVFPDAITVTEQ
ncbi:MAG: polymer-forming cytoskeletal protein [Oscillospiraceae bacterium]|nr:polymer-forming cytoskeletal protein [Oscillospiraceae bacterium]